MSDMIFDSFTHAARWLDVSTFGAKKGQAEALQNQSAKAWFDAQIALPITSHQAQVEKQFKAQGFGKIPFRATRVRAWLDIAFFGEDQLRQRLGYALSQIFVLSDQDPVLAKHAAAVARYNDLLCEHAFGNYSHLLKAVTLSPAMGQYLTMVDNKKANPVIGRKPDENYAREIMQLFSIGLYQRELDGSYRLGADGKPIPCYDENDIQQLARIFTGWNRHGKAKDKDFITPMKNNDVDHDRGEKQVLGVTFKRNSYAEEELDQVMEMLLNHPSTAPNICKNLIQKLTTSNPSPAYVRRVVDVFLNNGSGEKGDLKAVFWTILSDEEVFGAPPLQMSKIREPWLSLVAIYRALDVKPGGDQPLVGSDLVFKKTCNQYPLGSPSVFNFYLPDFAPKGVIKDKRLVSPEMQIVDWSHVIFVHNHILSLLRVKMQDAKAPLKKQLYVDVEDFKQFIRNKDINGFIEQTSARFFNGVMPASLKNMLASHYDGANAPAGIWVQRLLFIALSSPYYHVQENRA